jgi:hypothetical protein
VTSRAYDFPPVRSIRARRGRSERPRAEALASPAVTAVTLLNGDQYGSVSGRRRRRQPGRSQGVTSLQFVQQRPSYPVGRVAARRMPV